MYQVMTFNLNSLVIIIFPLFAISLPFNGVEWDIFGINRFEIKITMITFMLLFFVWVQVIHKNGIKYNKNVIFIHLLLLYIYVHNIYQ